MKSFSTLFLVALFALTVGCHAQVAPAGHSVSLTWGTPATSSTWTGCTTAAPCSYVVSRATLASGTANCPTAVAPAYTPLDSSSPTTSLAYSDPNAGGLTVCYVVQTEQGTAVSSPSNIVGPFVVPGNPTAPTLQGTQAEAKPLPTLPDATPELASAAPVLHATIVANR